MTSNSSETSCVTIDVGGDRHDELFDVLSSARRRLVLRSLQVADREMSVSELTSDIVSWETDITDEDIDDLRGTVEVALVHTHLPKMARAGLISYDDDTRTVVLMNADHELNHHLDAVGSPAMGDD